MDSDSGYSTPSDFSFPENDDEGDDDDDVDDDDVVAGAFSLAASSMALAVAAVLAFWATRN